MHKDPSGHWAELYKGFVLVKGTGFNIRPNLRFLSRSFCMNFAFDVIRLFGSGSGLSAKLYGMSATRIAAELFSHAVVYYTGYATKRALSWIGISISHIDTLLREVGDTNINNDDKKATEYYIVWYSAGFILNLIPAKYRAYIKV